MEAVSGFIHELVFVILMFVAHISAYKMSKKFKQFYGIMCTTED